jgi:hypothetical protein
VSRALDLDTSLDCKCDRTEGAGTKPMAEQHAGQQAQHTASTAASWQELSIIVEQYAPLPVSGGCAPCGCCSWGSAAPGPVLALLAAADESSAGRRMALAGFQAGWATVRQPLPHPGLQPAAGVGSTTLLAGGGPVLVRYWHCLCTALKPPPPSSTLKDIAHNQLPAKSLPSSRRYTEYQAAESAQVREAILVSLPITEWRSGWGRRAGEFGLLLD